MLPSVGMDGTVSTCTPTSRDHCHRACRDCVVCPERRIRCLFCCLLGLNFLPDYSRTTGTVTVTAPPAAKPSRKTYDLNTQSDQFLARYASAPFPEAIDANEKELAEVKRHWCCGLLVSEHSIVHGSSGRENYAIGVLSVSCIHIVVLTDHVL